MKLVTWNINSLRMRMGHVARLVDQYNPDVVCFQETKVRDEQFPLQDLEDLGFEHVYFAGEKSYNGVAIASKIPFSKGTQRDWCAKGDKRHCAVTLENGVELHNFYIPAGGDEPDVEINPKFAHKLDFLAEMTAWSESLEDQADTKRIIVGDFNIAPLEQDVWDTKKLKKVVSHTPLERETLNNLQAAGAWVDAMRTKIPPTEPCFTWWSYRAKDWRASNKGRRLDHVWVSPATAPAIGAVEVLLDLRGGEKPSDHAPVLVTFDL